MFHFVKIFVVVLYCLVIFHVSADSTISEPKEHNGKEHGFNRLKRRASYGKRTYDSDESSSETESSRRKGCYQDKGDRQLGNHHWDLSANSVPVCIAACRQANFKYAGPQNGNQCFCGDSLPPEKISDSKCNSKCNGALTDTCGGYWALEIFETNLNQRQRFDRVGCFRDKGERQLGRTHWDFPMNSPSVCIAACRQAGYRFAGPENGNQCFCGNLLPPERIPDIHCNSKCNGVDRFCGGYWALEVFKTGL